MVVSDYLQSSAEFWTHGWIRQTAREKSRFKGVFRELKEKLPIEYAKNVTKKRMFNVLVVSC